MTGATRRNFDVFEQLCGPNGCKSVVLGTTKWSLLPKDDKNNIGATREDELRKDYWSGMIMKGSTMMRADDKSSQWRMVETALQRTRPATDSFLLQIQNEMVDKHRELSQTEAAKLLKKQIEDQIKSLKNQGATQEEIRDFVQDVGKLKLSFGARLRGLFRW